MQNENGDNRSIYLDLQIILFQRILLAMDLSSKQYHQERFFVFKKELFVLLQKIM